MQFDYLCENHTRLEIGEAIFKKSLELVERDLNSLYRRVIRENQLQFGPVNRVRYQDKPEPLKLSNYPINLNQMPLERINAGVTVQLSPDTVPRPKSPLFPNVVHSPRVFKQVNSVYSVKWSPDGTRFAYGAQDMIVHIHSIGTNGCDQQILTCVGHQAPVTCVAWSPDSTKIISGSTDRTIRLWDANTGVCLRVMGGHDDIINAVDYSNDGKYVACGSSDTCARLWSAETGQIQHMLSGQRYSIHGLCFSPDNKYLAVGTSDGSVRIWELGEAKKCKMSFKLHSNGVNTLLFTPDAMRLFSGSSDGSIRVIDMNAGRQVLHIDDVNSVIWSLALSGNVLYAGYSDKMIRAFDVTNGSCVATSVIRHDAWVTSVSLSPDGKRLISGSMDGRIILWDSDTLDLIEIIVHDTQ